MDSIDTSCNEVKHSYDNCFNKWYTDKFLVGKWESGEEPCSELFKIYKQCLDGALEAKKIDPEELLKAIPAKGVHDEEETSPGG